MKTNLLKKILYLPNYLSLPVAGIEICNGSIKYVEFFNKRGALSVKNFGEVLLSPNIVKNGDILDKKALVKSLVEVKNNISADFVRVSMPEEKTYIFDVQIPKEAKTNIRETLEFKIEENVPLKLEESSFEYEIVDDNKSGRDMMLNVSVIPKKVISDYTDVFEQAGIYPLSYEIGSKMIANSVIPMGSKRNSIIVNIKDESTMLVVVIDGFVRFTSLVPIGESVIKQNLLKAGLFSSKIVDNKFFENDFSFETTYSKEIYLSLVNIFSVLKDEVEKFSEYIVNNFSSAISSTNDIDSIILCGRCATLPGLAKHINQNLNATIILANVWSNVFGVKEFVPDIKFQNSLNFVTPVGLSISSYKQTNA